ncbi:MAG: glycerate kinase [Candidatus Kuenenia sp.]|nr:glycerate kinase [Candidatus Kuenenia hertensis]
MSTSKISREDARQIYFAGLHSVEADACIQKCMEVKGNCINIKGKKTYNLDKYNNIYLTGFGKVSGFMAAAVEKLLGDRIKKGIVNVRYGYTTPCKYVKLNSAGHPIPDVAGINGTKEIVDIAKKASENDLVFCLISGGGSALFELPYEGISLEEIRDLTAMLLKCGATIDEMNAIRKHLSRVKGGRFAKLCKAEIVSVILSDVINDPLDTIASGATSPDSSTFLDCERILNKYDLYKKIPASIRKHVQSGLHGSIEETPKPGDKIFARVNNIIVGNNRTALVASKEKGQQLGYNTLILSSCIKGEAKEIAKVFGAIAREIHFSGYPVKRPACIIAGGESTVTVKGDGLGGRNQEFSLSAAMEIDGLADTVILSAGTDGTDGGTDAAGAMVDGTTIMNAKSKKLNPEKYLSNNDSFSFFKETNELIVTGPTKTNVMDIMLLLVNK